MLKLYYLNITQCENIEQLKTQINSHIDKAYVVILFAVNKLMIEELKIIDDCFKFFKNHTPKTFYYVFIPYGYYLKEVTNDNNIFDENLSLYVKIYCSVYKTYNHIICTHLDKNIEYFEMQKSKIIDNAKNLDGNRYVLLNIDGNFCYHEMN